MLRKLSITFWAGKETRFDIGCDCERPAPVILTSTAVNYIIHVTVWKDRYYTVTHTHHLGICLCIFCDDIEEQRERW